MDVTSFSADDFAGSRIRTLHTSPSSEVYTVLCNKAFEHVGGTEVVIKRTKITGPNDMKRFDKELELLHACSHPSILKPFGVFRVPPTYALVLPHFERGSLFGLLHSKGIALSLPTKLSIARDLTLAIAHMHERGLLHRDIKSDNVLVHGDGRIVIADFNAAEWETLVTSDIVMQARPTGGFFKQFVVGTLPYMAPELLRSVRGAAYTRACDVYSLAITINEVLTQVVPYSDAMTEQIALHTILEARYNHEALTVAIASDGLRPARPSVEAESTGHAAAIEDTSAIVDVCWADDAASRLDAHQAAARLDAVLAVIGGPPPAGSLFDPMSDGASPSGKAGDAVIDDMPAPSTVAAMPNRTNEELLAEVAAALGSASSTEQLPPALRVGWEASSGRRGADRMEDRTVVCAVPGIALAAVFDGHNGDAAAEYCRAHLVRAIHAAWPRMAASSAADQAEAALKNAFLALHDAFLTSSAADDSGCTALAVLCLPGVVVTASAGDCRCVLWRDDSLVTLNVEHTAAIAEERARVEAAGATVSTTSDGKLRVGGIIQVTRCIGDRPLRHLGLTSEPEITRTPLDASSDDKALILASDGLWDVIPHERVLHGLKNTAKSPDLIAKRLLTEALDRGTTDNTSLAVIFLKALE